jgi:mannitol-1-phosphate/altronate dehydrogenase
MPDEWVHLHIGAGALGLGMVIPLCRDIGLTNTILFNRVTSKTKPQKAEVYDRLGSLGCYLVDSDKGETLIENVHFFHDLDQAAQQIGAPSDPAGALITVAVGAANLSSVAETLVRLAAEWHTAHGSNKPFYVIACENDERASSRVRQVALELNPDVIGRVCTGPTLDGARSVRVNSESYFSWVVEVPNEHPLESDHPFLAASTVRIVSDLKPWYTKKILCMNAIHLALAICSQVIVDPPIDQLNKAILNADIRELITSMQQDITKALLLMHPGNFTEEELRDIHEDILERLAAKNDTVDRILHDVADVSWSTFLLKIGERLVVPLEVLQRNDQDGPALTKVLKSTLMYFTQQLNG